MKIIWSNQARNDYYKILSYLFEHWGLHEVKSFIDKTEDVIELIKKHPNSSIESNSSQWILSTLLCRKEIF